MVDTVENESKPAQSDWQPAELKAYLWPLSDSPLAMVAEDDPDATMICSFPLVSADTEGQLEEIRQWLEGHDVRDITPLSGRTYSEWAASDDGGDNRIVAEHPVQGFSFKVISDSGLAWALSQGLLRPHHSP